MQLTQDHSSYSLISKSGGYIGDCIGDYYRAFKGDIRRLDYGSFTLLSTVPNAESIA